MKVIHSWQRGYKMRQNVLDRRDAKTTRGSFPLVSLALTPARVVSPVLPIYHEAAKVLLRTRFLSRGSK